MSDREQLVRLLFDLSDWSDPMDAAEKSADAIFARWKLSPADPPPVFPCGHPRDAQTTRHTCATGDYHIPPHEHEWADLHSVIGCGICRLAKDDVS